MVPRLPHTVPLFRFSSVPCRRRTTPRPDVAAPRFRGCAAPGPLRRAPVPPSGPHTMHGCRPSGPRCAAWAGRAAGCRKSRPARVSPGRILRFRSHRSCGIKTKDAFLPPRSAWSLMSTQYASPLPRPTRPRSWCSADRPYRSAFSMTMILAFGTSTPTSMTVVDTSTSSSPALNGVHHGGLFRGLQPPVHQPDAVSPPEAGWATSV